MFRNEPAAMAGAFADALHVVDRFDHVVFAIRDELPGTPVYRAFRKRLVGSVEDSPTSG
ncbi:hypothetical protein ACLQ25_27110 [Micromonospora sp. DT44]|uniref:hypothetical protein n=1 Tax=Micromonospora sp. DT44 TaxID=3393439 RepID=UPI003CE6E792